MATELDVLRIVSDRLEQQGLSFMLTGSFALAYYATPRMTRDLDIVVALRTADVDRLVRAFSPDFYVDADAARLAAQTQQLFNLLHLESGIKVDLIVRKSSEYRQLEFERRARDADSELQLRDVRALLREPLDSDYVQRWAETLGVTTQLKAASP